MLKLVDGYRTENVRTANGHWADHLGSQSRNSRSLCPDIWHNTMVTTLLLRSHSLYVLVLLVECGHRFRILYSQTRSSLECHGLRQMCDTSSIGHRRWGFGCRN